MKILYIMLLAIFLSQAKAYGVFHLDLVPKPNPPDVGENSFEITLTDDKNPIEGATIEMVLSMPAMGSMPYMEEKAIIKPLGAGKYRADYAIKMGGSWEVVSSVKKGSEVETFHYSLTTQIPGLVSKDENHTLQNPNTISLGPDRLQKMGVRFAQVKKSYMVKTLQAVGIIEADPTQKSDLVLRFAGYIAKQFSYKIGDFVDKGSPLLKVYSPELVSAQNEFFLAHSEGNHNLHEVTLSRLTNLGLSEKDIAGIKSTGQAEREVTITAPDSGTILGVNVREGSSFAKDQVLYAIGKLNQSYIVAQIFQKNLVQFAKGQKVAITLPGNGRKFEGYIELIYPNFKEGVGTASVRISVEETSTELIPGIYVDLSFNVDLGEKLVIPLNAVLHSGLHEYIFLDHGQGFLEPKEINLGVSNDESIEVISGLKEGDRVAASGTFLLSSEAQLRSALPKWESKK